MGNLLTCLSKLGLPLIVKMISDRILFLALILASLNWQCHGTKDIVSSNNKIYLFLEKGGCLVNCKTYSIRIEKSGLADYTGKVNVSKTGRYFRKLSDEESAELWEFIEKNDIFEFSGFSGNIGEDSQVRNLVLSRNGKDKTITYGPLAPKVLMTLEGKIESIAESGKWEKHK
ncbi:MAG: hypothetical protein IIB38_06650 [Candidatus Hydrogenedentes bacterium]|nr:hypothetical protein [Candidatus Hydrogenedentota bacterium]